MDSAASSSRAGQSLYQMDQGGRSALNHKGGYHALPRPAGVVMLADIKQKASPLLKNASASLWDIGDGVACFEFTSKMNSLDNEMLKLLSQSVPLSLRTALKRW